MSILYLNLKQYQYSCVKGQGHQFNSQGHEFVRLIYAFKCIPNHKDISQIPTNLSYEIKCHTIYSLIINTFINIKVQGQIVQGQTLQGHGYKKNHISVNILQQSHGTMIMYFPYFTT